MRFGSMVATFHSITGVERCFQLFMTEAQDVQVQVL